MKLLQNIVILILFVCLPALLFGIEGFEKNTGQITYPNGDKNQEVLYAFNDNGIKITLRKSGFSYEYATITDSLWKERLHEVDKDLRFSIHQERIDFTFPQLPSDIIESDAIDFKKSYYTRNGYLEAQSYRTITYKNVAEGFNIVFKVSANGFKYDIIKKSGAQLEHFYLNLGTDGDIKQSNKEVSFELKNATISERIPLSYVRANNKPVDIRFDLQENQLKLLSEEDLTNEEIVIDPEPDMVWSTFWGGDQYDLTTDATLSLNDTIYTTGMTMSANNIATSGAYQTNYQGDLDIFISKFSNNGNLIWSTYYNGPQTERVYAIDTDENGDVFVAGCTFSTTGIVSGGAQQSSINGNDDLFILRMSPQGSRLWCTYHGGNGHDFVTDMHVENDTIYMVGHTTSSNVIASSGSHQDTYTANEAGHITLFSTAGDFLWGTYFGTEDNNSIEGLAVLESRLYITGRTSSENGISTTGAYQENQGGFTNAFVSAFTKNGTQIWGTYFGGQYTDVANDIALDSLDGVYIVGDASSDNNIGTSGAYQETRLSSEQGFIAHFDKDGNRLWATYTGGTGSDYVKVVTSRQDGLFYIGGHTTSTETIPSAGTYQPNAGGNYDGFIQQFDFDGNYQWGTFLGGLGSEDLLSLALTSSNNLIATGSTDQNDTVFATGNSYNDQYGGGTIDGFVAYLCQSTSPEIYYSNDSLHTIDADSYEWFLDGQPLNLYSQSILPPDDGVYTVEISAQGKCPVLSDTFNYSTIGILENQETGAVVFPNPTSGIVNVKSITVKKLIVLDLTGRKILSSNCLGECTIDLSGLNEGTYYLFLLSDAHTVVKTLVKI